MLRATRSFAVSYAAATCIGGRESNEDSVLALELDSRYCFVVADGLGGHGAGDIASKLLTGIFEREFGNAKDCRGFLKHAFDVAQQELLALQAEKGAVNQMKTTAVAACIINGKIAWGHAGDSRLYHYKKGILAGRTLDHSVPQMLVASGEIKEDEIAKHPDRSRLLRAFGDKWDVPKYEISKEVNLRKNSAFLLCTDGIWEHVSKEILMPPKDVDANADSWLAAIMDDMTRLQDIDSEIDMDNYSVISVIVR
ncbi:MAG: protein phosphatase 2C domain-containing protein [Defluviitaleaceae bacterium]|nr:protein phosphatase 2C domain-containing protein [Defluviitaleaceae bacterium]